MIHRQADERLKSILFGVNKIFTRSSRATHQNDSKKGSKSMYIKGTFEKMMCVLVLKKISKNKTFNKTQHSISAATMTQNEFS